MERITVASTVCKKIFVSFLYFEAEKLPGEKLGSLFRLGSGSLEQRKRIKSF